MIKLRVEWHHTCPDCGTRVVVDFAADANGFRICPWCGRVETGGQAPAAPADRAQLFERVCALEEQVNAGLPQIN